MAIVDDRTKERTLLLMRFYWLEDIYNIGKELNISSFDIYRNYWDIGYDEGYKQAALEIAQALSDQDLLQLVRNKPPRYKLQMGGFQGAHYTSSEAGELKLESSWGTVRENTKRALEKWKDRAYGVLKAIINRGGRSAYFDLIDATEKVLGYEVVPSFLLPSLAPLKLVFKTGSNKYPDWTMPPEIITVVQEELKKYEGSLRPKRAVRPRAEEDASAQVIHSERVVRDLVTKIVETRRNIDLLFFSHSKTKARLFKQNEMAVLDISKLCGNEEDFNNRVLSLTSLIGEIESDAVKSELKAQPRGLTGSISVIETWLNEIWPEYDTRLIGNLRMIQILRSKKYPIHVDTSEFVKALEYFGSAFPVTDWQGLWETVLHVYLESLKGLEEILRHRYDLSPQKGVQL